MSTKTQVTESLTEKLPIKIGFIPVNHKKWQLICHSTIKQKFKHLRD